VAGAAVAAGVRALAVGVAPLGGDEPMEVIGGPRYQAQLGSYRGLVHDHAVCALHVHVAIPDRERGALVVNHLRPWLPALVALTANAPFSRGRDTGYASWRRVLWQRRPASGPPPFFPGLTDYERLVRTLTGNGTLVDERSLFWDLRLSSRYPTVEVRAADVPGTAEESTLLAALVRALVMTAPAAVDRGDPGPQLQAEVLRAACWLAARDGLRGQTVDALTGLAADAAQLPGLLLRYAGPALEATGDLPTVATGLRRLLALGSGADRQRTAHARRGSVADAVDAMVEQTVDSDRGLLPMRTKDPGVTFG
jgi:carboxylate-amine ligase